MDVSWYSSRSTTRYAARIACDELVGAAHELGAQPHVVGEVQSAGGLLRPAQLVDEVGELEATRGRVADVLHGLGRLRQLVDGGDDGAIVGAQLVGGDRLLGEVGVEPDDVAGDPTGPMPVTTRPRGLADHAVGELGDRGAGQQAGARLDADAQALLVDEAAGERVVGGDRRLPDRLAAVRWALGAPVVELGGDPLGEFGGRLVGERRGRGPHARRRNRTPPATARARPSRRSCRCPRPRRSRRAPAVR